MAERRYRIELLPTAWRELAKLPKDVRRRLGRAIDGLASEPRPTSAKLLVGSTESRVWRIRVGDYRVLYEIRDDVLVLLVVRVGDRREAYRGTHGGR